MTDYANERAACLTNAKPYIQGPYVPRTLSVNQRDTHHWDIYAPRRAGYVEWYLLIENPQGFAWPAPTDHSIERAFAIRGEPGKIYIRDERWDPQAPRPRALREFTSVDAAMAWVTSTLLTGTTP